MKKLIISLTCILFTVLAGCSESKNHLTNQWAILNSGQKINGTKGISGIDVGLPNCTSLTLLDHENIIAVVDSSISTKSEAFAGINLETISDYNSAYDDHGTAVTGIITTSDFYKDYISILRNTIILSIIIDPNNLDELLLIKDLKVAEEKGAKIVNCSFVMEKPSEPLYNFIANSKMLFVCAVGNDHKEILQYPAAYSETLNNIISVVGINNYGYCSRYSNYSAKADIAAPGENILCINSDGTYNYYSGSSFAAPFVTSACAFYINRTHCTASETKAAILANTITLDSLSGMVNKNRFLSIKNIVNQSES